jgi:hypothetical protein
MKQADNRHICVPRAARAAGLLLQTSKTVLPTTSESE